MAYMVVLLSTRWGSELGGLNVFNRGLAEGMAQPLPSGSRTICFVKQLPAGAVSLSGGVELFENKDLAVTELVRDIAARCKEFETDTLQGVLVVGHDIITGQVALDCATELQIQLSGITDVKSAVIGHMDYSAYAFKKNLSLEQVTARSTIQREVIAAANCAFAVGPLLQRNFASARSVTYRPRSPVRPLIPGVERIQLQPYNPRVDLQVFISGRLNREDDPIKNSILAIHALAAAYVKGRTTHPTVWQGRGQLFAFGVDPVADAASIEQLKEVGRINAAFEVHAEPFSNDQTALYRRLANCHIALMPSWHEGFGLSGWEAICAGVPLICSRQSGLAMFLDDLKQQFPDLSFKSIEFVNVEGGPAADTPNRNDIEQIADALLHMMVNIEERKQAALDLARLLKHEFSWKRCASDLLRGTDWYFPGSTHWADRQIVGRQTNSREVIERILTDLGGLDLEEDWRDLTTAFNYLSDAGKNAQLLEKRSLYEKLRTIGSEIGQRMAVGSPSDVTARESGRMDVCWRFMAACASVCESFREFSQLFPDAMLQAIWRDTFLTKELFYYSASFAKEFLHQAKDIASDFFAPVQFSGNEVLFATRLARLASRYPELTQIFPTLECAPVFVEERERCAKVTRHAHDIAQIIADDPRLASTALALMTLGLEPARQVADQTVSFFRVYYPDAGTTKGHWRGDKRVFAALATASLTTHSILEVLRWMAQDEDESIRWAALHLSFSHTLRRRLEAAVGAGTLSLDAPLNQVLGNIVDTAVSIDAGHPWLHREFLAHYLEERTLSAQGGMPSPFTVLDFPTARWLIGPIVGETAPQLRGHTHPEVADTRTNVLQAVKRILLVLPPIEIDDNASGASRTSTPALGLGLLASHLAAQGHDVQVADCHRFPKLRAEVLHVARTFDMIGFNTVFSTIRSTMKMLVDIRNRTQSTTLVIGGPAAKLNAWQFSTVHVENAQTSWDFAISSDAVENLSALVASLRAPGLWPAAPGIIPNRQSWNVLGRGVAETSNVTQIYLQHRPAWLQVELDRRVYRIGNEQYEPARTRSQIQRLHEAHVVMSQGCDWDCAFCTERRSRSGGEQRRDVAHVLQEIRTLILAHRHLRIQFIDDNLLPQIASDAKRERAAQYGALAWANDFLDGLAELRANAGDSFGWRGIFRIEDFFAYEAQFAGDDFIAKLQLAGCRMLAFGIEHGSEEQRRKNKTAKASVSNDNIRDLFQRLRAADILTKAYFMLGGPWENQETANQTIDFAIESGVTLAYFALYKDFSRATAVLSKEQQGKDPKSEGFIHYDQLELNWDQIFSLAQESQLNVDGKNTMASGPICEEELACYSQLTSLGFRFADLVKYNDFHNEGADEGKLLRTMTWGSPAEYFKTVEQAYRRFYLRPAFVQDYSALLSHGY